MSNNAQKLLDYARLYGAKIRISIQVGDVVKLKTGGPEMTVVDVDEDDIVTGIYFVETELYETELPSECLALKVYEAR